MKQISIKLSIVLWMLLSIVSFSSCSEKVNFDDIEIKSTWTEQCENANNWQLGTMEKALAEIENTPLEDLSETYDYISFENSIGAYRRTFFGEADFSSELVFGTPTVKKLQDLNQYFPVERIEKIDADHVFAVYRVEIDGEQGYFYVVAEKAFNREDEKTTEIWCLTGYSYVNIRSLSHSDFEDIKIGDSASDVKKIDNSMFESLGRTRRIRGNHYFDVSCHVLEDGILTFYYTAPYDPSDTAFPKDEEIKVAKIEFTKDVTGIGAVKYINKLNHFAFMYEYGIFIWIAVAVVIFAIAIAVILVLRKHRKRAAPAKTQE